LKINITAKEPPVIKTTIPTTRAISLVFGLLLSVGVAGLISLILFWVVVWLTTCWKKLATCWEVFSLSSLLSQSEFKLAKVLLVFCNCFISCLAVSFAFSSGCLLIKLVIF
jgi:hypothetical protein